MHKRTLISIGYWASDDEPNLPHPQNFYDDTVEIKERELVINYLKNGLRLHDWMGFSYCRFGCQVSREEIGNACLTDGVYIWPEGLVHYVETHKVWLPEIFITHVKSRFPLIKENILCDELTFGNFEWWEQVKKLY